MKNYHSFRNIMKLIVGIIATDHDAYQTEAQKVWKTYMHKHSDVTSFFLKVDNTKQIKKPFILLLSFLSKLFRTW